jgi:hypothetical protein
MSGYRRTTPRQSPVPAYDPAPSGAFAARALAGAGVEGALIGRLAVWSWLSDEGSHRFTKDVDLAVSRSDMPALRAWLATEGVHALELPIGGVAVRLPDPTAAGSLDAIASVRVDFIERTNAEYGDFGDVFGAAVADAQARGQRVQIGDTALLVVSPTYLVLLKIIAGRAKDDDDIEDLLRQAEVDVDFLRETMRQHRGLAAFRTRFEDKLRRIGHAQARRDDEES